MKEKIILSLLAVLVLFIVYLNPTMLFQSHNSYVWATWTGANGKTMGNGAGSYTGWNGVALGPTYSLNGVGAPDKSVVASTTQLVFPTTQTIGSTVTLTMTITNNGPWNLTPTTSISATGTTWFGATISTASVAPAGTETIQGTFNPTDTAARAGTLYINW